MKIIYLLLMILGVVSCTSYKMMDIEVFIPAQCELGENQNVAFWVQRQSFVNDTSYWYYHTEGMSRDELSFNFYSGVANVLKDNKVCDSVFLYLNGNSRLLLDSVVPAPSNIRILTDAVKIISFDKIIALELIDYGDVEPNFECTFLMRIYDVHTEKMIQEKQVKCALDCMMVFNGGVPYILNSVYDVAQDYAYSLFSHWEMDQRRMYTGGRMLEWGNYLLIKGSYNDALNAYEKIEGKEKVKALLNSAYAHEMLGRIDLAKRDLKTLEESCTELKCSRSICKYIKEYIKMLEDR